MGEALESISCECGEKAKRQFPTRTSIRFPVISGGGASLVDTYDREFAQMEANGEFTPHDPAF